MMSSKLVNITTRSQTYDTPLEKKDDSTPSDKPIVSIPPTNNLHIEKHVLDTIFRSPKSTIQKLVLNPNVQAT